MTTQFTCTGADGTFITYSTADANGRYNVPFTLIPNTAANLNVYLWDATDQEYDLIQQNDATNPWVYDPANNRIDFDGAGPAVGTATLPDGSTQGTLMLARVTDVSEDELAQFTPGSSIRSQDLNDNFNKLGNAIEELHCNATLNGEDFEAFYWNKVDVDAGGDTYTSTSTSAWPNNNTTIATTAAGDDRWLGIPGGGGTTITAGDGIALNAAEISVDLADTTPGLQFDSGDLQVIGNSVTEAGGNVRLTNGPSNVTVTGAGGINVTRTSATELTITDTADNNTTYDLSAVAATGNVNLRLTSTNPAGTDDVLITAGNNVTFANITANGFTINAAGGGGGGDGVTVVANAAGLNALVDLPGTEPTDGQVVLVQNSTNLNANAASGDNDEDINGLPMTVATGGPEGGYGNQIQVTVTWDADDDEWDFVRWVPVNSDNRYVLEAGDTMTGTLTIDNTTADQNALVTGAGHDIVLGNGANVVFDGANGDGTLTTAALTANRTYTLPDATGTVALTTDITAPGNGALTITAGTNLTGTTTGGQFTANKADATTITLDVDDVFVLTAGDTMTGNLVMNTANITGDQNAITAGAGNFNLNNGNFWTLGAVVVPNPTNMAEGISGLIVNTAAATWPAAGGATFQYAANTPPNITEFPAVIPFYCTNNTTIFIGTPTVNIV